MGVLKALVDGVWTKVGCGGAAAGFSPVSDDFNRSNSATVLGGPWSLYSTSGSLANIDVGISSSKGYVSRSDTVSSHVTKAFAYVDTGSGDVDMTIAVSGFSGFEEAGIVVRLKPDGSHIRITRNSVYTVSAVSGNSYTVTDLSLATHIGSGATVRIVCTGTVIEVFKNGVSQGTVTTSHNQTATRHGWSTDAVFDPAARFDDFTIAPAVPAATGRLRLWTGSGWVREACDNEPGTTFTDDFNRSDSALTTPWVQFTTGGATGTVDIASNQTAMSTTVSTTQSLDAGIDTGSTDQDASVTITALPTTGIQADCGIHYRNAGSYSYAGSLVVDNRHTLVHYREDGTYHDFNGVVTVAAGDVLRVVARGRVITVYSGGVLRETYTLSADTPSGMTFAGVHFGAGAGAARLDDFSVTAYPIPHPLKIEDPANPGTWITVACMVPV